MFSQSKDLTHHLVFTRVCNDFDLNSHIDEIDEGKHLYFKNASIGNQVKMMKRGIKSIKNLFREEEAMTCLGMVGGMVSSQDSRAFAVCPSPLPSEDSTGL